MRILVFSDTHGDVRGARRAMQNIQKFDAVFHLGDYESDVRELMKGWEHIPVYRVRGNCDTFSDAPSDLTVTLEGVTFFLTHGHKYNIRTDRRLLADKAKEVGASIALYGHLHITDDSMEDGIRLFSPGSPSNPRQGEAAFGVIEIENNKAQTMICDYMI